MSHDDTLVCVVSCKKILVSMTCTVPTGAPAQNRAKGPVFFSYTTGHNIAVLLIINICYVLISLGPVFTMWNIVIVYALISMNIFD